MNTLEDYKNKGREICKTYLEFKDQYPIMLPPAPKQAYIDVYIDEEGASSSKFDDEKCKQANYEAEVLTYRALERLPEERCVVLHCFEFTHHQYRICDKSHVRKNCKPCKGKAADKTECDFVVIGKNYVVIIEVKNVPIDEDGELTEEQRMQLTGTLKGSLKQLERTKLLINGLIEQVFVGMEGDQCSIICLSAFPSTSRDRFQNMDEQTKRQILCKEDFLDFPSWWENHVPGLLPSQVQTPASLAKHQEMQQVLVAIYCTDKNICDKRKCSLGKAIMDIDGELKKGNITFLSKNRQPNPNVIKVTDIMPANIDGDNNIFKDILGIEYLTAEQHDAFNRDQNLLVINGPAGSGKTIILLAKIIKVIKSDVDNRAVLFIYSEDNKSCKRYQDALQKADISNKVIIPDNYMADNQIHYSAQMILGSNCRVVIVRTPYSSGIRNDTVTELIKSSTHVFIDDWQGMAFTSVEQQQKFTEILRIFNTIRKTDDWKGKMFKSVKKRKQEFSRVPSPTSCVWIACDFTQAQLVDVPSYNRLIKTIYSFIRDVPSKNIVTLSLNLRNSSDITDILSKIRKHIILQLPEKERQHVVSLPIMKQGHFIHGPLIVVHIIEKKCDYKVYSEVIDILNIELDKFCNTDVICGLKIGILYYNDIYLKFKEVIEERFRVFDNNKIEWCNIKCCYSVEYPAVIVLYDISDTFMDISSLYLQISRARVFCVVIVYNSSSYNLTGSKSQRLNDMFVELEDSVSVRVIRYN